MNTNITSSADIATIRRKANVLFWSLTALIAIPGIVLVLIGLVLSYLPPKSYFQPMAEGFMIAAKQLIHWRSNKVHWFIVDSINGYSLTVKE